MSKNILIICHGFYPEQNPRAFRATELSKEFRRRNMSVTVMSPDKGDINNFLNEWKILHFSLGKLKWRIYNFQGNNLIFHLYNRAVNRFLPKLLEYPSMELFFKVREAIKRTNEKYDAIITIAVPYTIHWAVASVWNKNSAKNIAPIWIADCGDPYFIQQNDQISTPFYFKWVEKWFMRKVNYITVPTNLAHQGYFPEFHNKMRVIPQGFKFEDVQLKENAEDGVIRFAYAGCFTAWRRDPSGILDYLTSLDPKFKFEFHIYSSDFHFVEKYVKKDSRIIFHGFKQRLELLSVLSQFNFMLNLENLGEAQSPSKLIDYGIIKKPILSLKSYDLNLELLKEFLSRNYASAFKINNVDDYRIENVVNQFAYLFDKNNTN
jgi:hypothetical protein